MNSIRWLAIVLLTASGDVAFAQQATPGLAYRSAFEGYRAFEEPEPRSWRGANEEAGALGGHGGHLKSSMPSRPSPSAKQQRKDDASPSNSTNSPAAKRPGGHEGHAK
ncbi:MAG TPA: hypothetical protein VNG69_16990 [Casimicrobiaceae bacterium]|nr:hypothetical protein [Casimicrobiaceae bacterium]